MAQDPTRRSFLRSAPLVAAVTLPLTERLLFAAEPLSAEPPTGGVLNGGVLNGGVQSGSVQSGSVQSGSIHTGTSSTPVPFQLFTAGQLAQAMQQLQAQPGNDNLSESKSLPFTIVLTSEEKKSAAQFEYHEGRDHILQVLEGSTLYQVGGTPQNPHSTRPGEWLAPASQGASSFTLKKGDMLVIPRGTPHKRSTEASVTFYLISTTGSPTS